MSELNDIRALMALYKENGGDARALAEVYTDLFATGKTPLGLNQWQRSDKPMMEDFNEDNRIVDERLRALDKEVQRLSQKKAEVASGTWTPTVTNAKLSDISTATWRKNGTHVQAAFRGNLQKGDVAGNVITFGGLPFAAVQRGICNLNTSLAFAANTMPIPGHVSGTTAQFWVWYISSGVSAYFRNQHIVSTGPTDIQVTCDYDTTV